MSIKQLFFDLRATDVKITEVEMHPKAKLQRGPKVSRRHQEKLNLLALLDQRSGSREEWGHFVYHVVIEVRDWRNGFYRACCGCSFEYKMGSVYPNDVCDIHNNIWEADFDSDEELLIAAKTKAARAWYFELPMIGLSQEGWVRMSQLCLNPTRFGYEKPEKRLGENVRINWKFGGCNCTFVFKEFTMSGEPWLTRPRHMVVLVRNSFCGNYGGSCPRSSLPKNEREATIAINRVIENHRVI